MEFFEHVVRREGLEHLAVTGKIEGKRGKPRFGYVKALSEWGKVDAKEMKRTTKSRVEWKTMTVNALKEQGTLREISFEGIREKAIDNLMKSATKFNRVISRERRKILISIMT